MAPLELEGATLGEKHRDYNKKLHENIVTQKVILDNELSEDDVNSLLKIDIASHNKDVVYILNVLKSYDMLHVSRALTRCKWLFIEQKYANIINTNYLQSDLFPKMSQKAINKLKSVIRHNLKDEIRAEEFYLSENNIAEAAKWLPHCSVGFIENNIEKHMSSGSIKLRLYKRLCEKSVSIFEIILKHVRPYETEKYLKAATFLLNTDVDKYLDIAEQSTSALPKLNHRNTELIMKHSPKRVIDNLETYVSNIHLPTFAKYIKIDEIKNFLHKQTDKNMRIYQYDILKHFVHRLPKDEQFDFVRKLCMPQKREELEKISVNRPTEQMLSQCDKIYSPFTWYYFTKFEIAFEQITKLITESFNKNETHLLFSILAKSANYNVQHIQSILKQYIKKHKMENVSYKLKFIKQILTHSIISDYDEATWNTLNELLTTFNKNEYNTLIVNSIIVYNVVNNLNIPEDIEKLFVFDTLKSYKSKMNQDQQNKLFNYLLNHLNSKLNYPITDENCFTESIKTLENILKLIRDWNKTLLDYPLVLDNIRQMIKLKKDNSWKDSLSSLYNVNKSWRKYMFEESLALCPNERVCLNALKHDPKLLARCSDEVTALKTDNTISLHRLHGKLRVYWPHSLAKQWVEEYLSTIKEPKGQRVTIQGLCVMLPQKPLLDIIEKYKPLKPKIDWKHTDELDLNIQRLLAKNMHRGRPQPNPDAILYYAKGDYLQFALPSLLAIFYNLNSSTAYQYILTLLDSPVSIQKHGIRFAFKKLDHDSLKTIFLNCWKTSKNATIRSIIFKYTHTLLCNEKDSTNAASLWEILELFIDNLTFTEDKEIYKTFSKIEEIPINVRPNYIVKSHRFLKKLIPELEASDRTYYESIANELAGHTKVVMETIDVNFVESIIKEYVDNDFFKYSTGFQYRDNLLQVISAYLLCCKDEEEQLQRYEKVFLPLIKSSFQKWEEKQDRTYYIKQRVDRLLIRLAYDLKEFVVVKKMIIPVKMFTLIMSELENALSVPENYIILTRWKLILALTQQSRDFFITQYDNLMAYKFGEICVAQLKNDTLEHFNSIYVLFSKCVKSLISLFIEDARLEFYYALLSNVSFVHAYLLAIEVGESNRLENDYEKIWKKIRSHPSMEVKMHYSNKMDKKFVI